MSADFNRASEDQSPTLSPEKNIRARDLRRAESIVQWDDYDDCYAQVR